MRTSRLLVCALPVFAGLLGSTARGGELEAFAGGLHSEDSNAESTYSWALEYRQPLFDSISASFTWLNEGHVTDHHRDGQAAQLWWRSKEEKSGLVFNLGLGPYRYYDTTRPAPDIHFQDAHGWGTILSAEADWYFASPWYPSIRLNQIEGHRSYNTTSVVFGLGYQFDEHPANAGDAGMGTIEPPPIWEADVYGGSTVANSFRSQTSSTLGLGGRAQVNEYLSASVTYLNIGHSPLEWHSGTAPQLWFEKNLTPQVAVAVGLGALFRTDESVRSGRDAPSDPSAIIGIGASYALSKRYVVRVVWDRVGTDDNHDADILLVGLGYRF
ncbi:MAG: outer membrane beta-barrel protein [Burkholderiaceae bacterium]